MKTICIYNNKGGVGKTSLAGAIAVEFVIKEKKATRTVLVLPKRA